MDKGRFLFTVCLLSILAEPTRQTDANTGGAGGADGGGAGGVGRGKGALLHRRIEPREYEIGEAVSTRCSKDEVVVVVAATFERHSGNGKCNASLPDNGGGGGGGGCTRDVRTQLDKSCSGNWSCNLRLNEFCRTLNDSCDRFGKYKITFDCVKVTTRLCRECSSDNSQLKLSESEGYLASVVTSERVCGAAQCPWVIRVEPGQAINVTLLDFSVGSRGTSSARGSRPASDAGCVSVREKANPKEVLECTSGRHREKQIYLSVSNSLEIYLTPKEAKFMVYYEATGCPDYLPPRGSRMQRTGNQCEIDCPGTELKWALTCDGNQWITPAGAMKCPGLSFAPGETDAHVPQSTSLLPSLPTGVLIALVVAVTVIIAVLVLTVGFYFLKKHQYEAKHKDAAVSLYGVPCSEFEFCDEFAIPRTSLVPKSGPGTVRSGNPHQSSDLLGPLNSYAADRQLDMRHYPRPLPSIPPADGSAGSWRRTNPKQQLVVQLHRTNSGAETVSFVPTMMLRDGRLPCNCGTIRTLNGAGASAERPPSHLYFTLDPEVKEDEPAVPVNNYPTTDRSRIGAENRTLPKNRAAANQKPANEVGQPLLHANSQNQIPMTVSNTAGMRNQIPVNQMNYADSRNRMPPMSVANGSNLPVRMNCANLPNQMPVNRVNCAESTNNASTDRANPSELQSLITKDTVTESGLESQAPMRLTNLSGSQSAECDAPLNLSLGSKRNMLSRNPSALEQNIVH